MTGQNWLDYYDQIAEIIDDEILDELDEEFGFDEENPSVPDSYFIKAAQRHYHRHLGYLKTLNEGSF
jgi:hypothetical protein